MEDAKATKEAMRDGEIDGNPVTLDWATPMVKVTLGVLVEAEVALEREVMAEEAKVDLVVKAREALEVEEAASEDAEEEETINHRKEDDV